MYMFHHFPFICNSLHVNIMLLDVAGCLFCATEVLCCFTRLIDLGSVCQSHCIVWTALHNAFQCGTAMSPQNEPLGWLSSGCREAWISQPPYCCSAILWSKSGLWTKWLTWIAQKKHPNFFPCKDYWWILNMVSFGTAMSPQNEPLGWLSSGCCEAWISQPPYCCSAILWSKSGLWTKWLTWIAQKNIQIFFLAKITDEYWTWFHLAPQCPHKMSLWVGSALAVVKRGFHNLPIVAAPFSEASLDCEPNGWHELPKKTSKIFSLQRLLMNIEHGFIKGCNVPTKWASGLAQQWLSWSVDFTTSLLLQHHSLKQVWTVNEMVDMNCSKKTSKIFSLQRLLMNIEHGFIWHRNVPWQWFKMNQNEPLGTLSSGRREVWTSQTPYCCSAILWSNSALWPNVLIISQKNQEFLPCKDYHRLLFLASSGTAMFPQSLSECSMSWLKS